MQSFLWRIYVFRFCNAFTLIFPIYVAMFVDIGLSPTQIGFCLTAWSVTTFLLQALAGAAADRWSRRYVLAFGQLAFAGCFTLWWVAPNFAGILAGLILWGIKSAATNGVYEALVFDTLKANERAEDYLQVLGRSRAFDSLGSLASAVGAALLGGMGYEPAIVGSIAAAVVGIVAAMALPGAPVALTVASISFFDRLRMGLGEVRRRPAVLAIVVFAACVWTMGPGLQEFWPVYGRGVGLSLSAISVIVGCQFVVEALGNLAAHRLQAVQTHWFYAAYLVFGLMLAAAAALYTAPGMALLIVYSGGLRLIDAVFEGRLQALIPSETRATIGAVKGLGVQMGNTCLYALIAGVAHAASYRAAFLCIGLIVFAMGLAWLAGSAIRARSN